MNAPALFHRGEVAVTKWMARYGVRLAAASLGIVYLWFGLLKLLPGHSPLQDLVGRTVLVMTFGLVPPTVSIPVLAFWECLIGLGFLSGLARRLTLVLFFVQQEGPAVCGRGGRGRERGRGVLSRAVTRRPCKTVRDVL